MNRIFIVLFTILIHGCKSEMKNSLIELKLDENPSELKLEKTKLDTILTTLVFDKNINGKELTEMYTFGLSELQKWVRLVEYALCFFE